MFSLRNTLAQLGGFNEYHCLNCNFYWFIGSSFISYICSFCQSSNLEFGPAGSSQFLERKVDDPSKETVSLRLPETITAEQLVDIFKTDF